MRGMRADADGLPMLDPSGRYLAVRPNVDILVDVAGRVDPETGGMSVIPPPVENMDPHRRPPEFGGTGKDPVFELQTDEMPGELRYRPDPANPEGHGFIEPSRVMSFEEYLTSIQATRALWRRVQP